LQRTKEELRMLLLQYSIEILKPANFHDQLAPAVMGYADLLSAYLVMNEEQGRKHIKTAQGNAIGTFWAANCVREIFRTQRFSRGLYTAVSDALIRNKKTVHVLYAGTGPFATLALPVMMMFKPEEVQFTFLEINPDSIDILKSVIDSLDLHAYIKDIHQCDAAVWDVSSSGVDIVISETMYKALSAEPQVAIMLNLASQLPRETVFLPEEIKVSICKWNQRDKEPEKLKELMNFNKALMYAIINKSSGRNWVFDDQQMQVSLSENEQLYFMTEIRVNEGNILNLNDSSLNLLAKVKLSGKKGIISLNCVYSLQETTGFKIGEN
jgi:predicted RNA methylase